MMNSFYNYPIFKLKKSKAVSAIAKNKQSIKEMTEEGGIVAYAYSDICQQFDDIINYMNNNK